MGVVGSTSMRMSLSSLKWEGDSLDPLSGAPGAITLVGSAVTGSPLLPLCITQENVVSMCHQYIIYSFTMPTFPIGLVLTNQSCTSSTSQHQLDATLGIVSQLE